MTERRFTEFVLAVAMSALAACSGDQDTDTPSSGGDNGAALGTACTDGSGCESRQCFVANEAGVCSVACGSAECPGGFDCLDFGNDDLFCAALCQSDGDCNGWSCRDLGDGGPPVCVPPVDDPGPAAQPFGATCAQDAECESGRCSVADGAGICTTNCSEFFGQPCTGDAVCVDVSPQGWTICVPRCSSDAECNGWRCGATTEGTQVCVPPSVAPAPEVDDVGNLCINDDMCDSGTCLRASTGGQPGYCTQECTGTGVCGRAPFLGEIVACVEQAERAFCFIACDSNLDCVGVTTCQLFSGVRVCLP